MTDGTYCESWGTSVAWISSGANKTLDDNDDDDNDEKKQETGSRFVFHYASPAQPHAALV